MSLIRGAGAEPLLLYMDWRDPAATVRAAVDKYKIKYLELGNEVFYTSSGMTAGAVVSTAKAYALQVKAIHQALQGSGCKLIVCGDFPHFGGQEIPAIKQAVPDIASYVDGVAMHPYTNAVGRLRTMYSQLATLSIPSSVPVWVTETGSSTADGLMLDSNYDEARDLTFAQAGARVRPMFDRIAAEIHNLAAFLWYEDIDQDYLSKVTDARAKAASTDPTAAAAGRAALVALAKREKWFGAYDRNGRPKGAFTRAILELAAWLNSSASLKPTG